jgi:hypothetical protein
MHALFSKNNLYTFALLVIPMLIIMSWFNASVGNTNYGALSYIITYILPAIVLSYGVAFLTAELLADAYGYSLWRVMFSLVGLTASLLLFSYCFSFFGFRSLFVTAIILPSPNAQDHAAKFYSLELAGALVFLALLYTIASYLFRIKKIEKEQVAMVLELEDEESVVKKKSIKKKSAKRKKMKKRK